MNRRLPGQRGGLAVPPPAVGAAAAAPPPPARRRPLASPARVADADDLAWELSSFRRIPWSLSLVGFLVYVFVVVTFRVPIADVGIIAALAGLFFLNRPLRFPGLLVGLAVLYVWGWVTWMTSDYRPEVQESLITLGKLLLILLVAVNVLHTRAEIRLYLIAFSLFFALYPARGTIVNYLGGYTRFDRALWNYTYANSNDLAAMTLLALSVAAAVLVWERNKWFRLGAFAAVIVLAVIILLTKSRGVFLGLAVFGIFALLPQMKRLRNFSVAGVILAAILMLAPADVYERLGGLRGVTDVENLQDVDREGSAAQRFAIWRVAWAVIDDHPLTGVGWGAYSSAHGQYSPIVDQTRISRGKRDTHSTYFNVTAEAGYPGLLIFCTIVLGVLIHASRARRRCREAMPRAAMQVFMLQLGLVGFMVAAVFASYAQINLLYLHMALLYGVAEMCNEDMARLQRSHPRALRNA